MRKLNEEEAKLHLAGQQAEDALKNPSFASAINELSEWLSNSIMNTKPEELQKRELHYHMHNALKELVGILNHRVAIKQQLEAELVEEENT